MGLFSFMTNADTSKERHKSKDSVLGSVRTCGFVFRGLGDLTWCIPKSHPFLANLIFLHSLIKFHCVSYNIFFILSFDGGHVG